MLRWLMFLAVLLYATVPLARGDQYWVAWEGNDFPENEGWLREGDGTRPTRTLHDGVMTLDSLASDESEDFYRVYGISDPEPGEEFVVEWGLRVNQVDWDNPNFPYDPGWSVNSAGGWRAVFAIGVDELHNLLEQVDVRFEPGVFHAWQFRSSDMRTFTIHLDRKFVSEGAFVATGLESRMSWGDLASGPTSSVDWDYFRFGVVPEPTMLSFLPVFAVVISRARRRP